MSDSEVKMEWVNICDAVSACLENGVSFDSSSSSKQAADGVARFALDCEDESHLSDKQKAVFDRRVLAKIHALECDFCSGGISYSEVRSFFDNGRVCVVCARNKVEFQFD